MPRMKQQRNEQGLERIAYAKIFPSIGIARVGDSESEFFFGPEFFPSVSEKPEEHRYRDVEGRIKRQAARFRLYGFDAYDQVVCELTAKNAVITWTAHLANKKAAWFAFDGAAKAAEQFAFADAAKHHVLRNNGIGTIVVNEASRRFEADDKRKTLEIDGGLKSVSGVNRLPAPDVQGDELRFKGMFKRRLGQAPSGGGDNQTLPAEAYDGHEVYLGELRTDDEGRLIVLGGHGLSQPVGPKGPAEGDDRLNYWITNYANNDHWYDDTSDGPVSAAVKTESGEIEVRGGAWVVVGPPDFAPDLTNLVTLYDVMEEVTLAAHLPLGAGAPEPRSLDRVGFHHDIEPVLHRANSLRWVSPLGLRGHGYAKPGVLEGAQGLSQAVEDSESGRAIRERFVQTLRLPNYNGLDPETGQPVVIADDDPVAVAQATASFMPPLSGDEGDRVVGIPKRWLTLTRLQHRRVHKWGKGDFDPNDSQPPHLNNMPPTLHEQPARLTRCALEATCGGAFFPGIEMTVIVRDPSLYTEAFRIDHGCVSAGDVTKYMACPWQADFYECRDSWWPAQRPDETVTDEAFQETVYKFQGRAETGGRQDRRGTVSPRAMGSRSR